MLALHPGKLNPLSAHRAIGGLAHPTENILIVALDACGHWLDAIEANQCSFMPSYRLKKIGFHYLVNLLTAFRAFHGAAYRLALSSHAVSGFKLFQALPPIRCVLFFLRKEVTVPTAVCHIHA